MTKTLIVSDIHIGDSRFNTKKLINVLNKEDFDQLILNGDIVDSWLNSIENIKKDPFIDVVKNIAETKQVYWVLGNHDQACDIFGKTKIQNDVTFTHNNYRFLVVHGNEVYPKENKGKMQIWLAKLNNRIYKWFGLDMQKIFRLTPYYKAQSKKMRTKLLNKYDSLHDYILMGHTHQIDYLCTEHTVLLDGGCPHITGTYILMQDDHICLRKIDDCA
jgi:putative phosphoesterase